MECKSEICEEKTYYCLTLDPIHVGTGGYRIGRVDNTIMREPGTDLPKIPGTGLCGVARAYTAMHFPDKYQRPRPIKKKMPDGTEKEEIVYDSCAGKGGSEGEGHCGNPDCPVCIPYGFTKKKQSLQGMAQFSDARILFFPVYSMIGPVWVTSPGILKEFNQSVELESRDKIRMIDPGQALEEQGKKHLNLGWLMLELEGEFNIDSTKFPYIADEIKNRLILVSDELFPQIVNDNLEVRTSVSIDPQTGAAESGALFTYEAIPRATVLWFTVTYNNPDLYLITMDDGKTRVPIKPPTEWHKQNPNKNALQWIIDSVEKGLNYIQFLGVGGMGTRGMGRIKILNTGGKDEEAT